MKKFLLFLFFIISFSAKSQVANTWADINQLKSNNQLYPGSIYTIIDMGKIQIVAKSNNTFYETPFVRTPYALEYDFELFNFDTKILTGIDEISCVARCSSSSWYLINDAGHKPYKVSSTSNNLVIHFTKTYDKVLGFSTSLDDSYSASNYVITAGASVGFSSATIYFHKTVILNTNTLIKVLMTPQELSITGSNIWIMGMLSKQIQLTSN